MSVRFYNSYWYFDRGAYFFVPPGMQSVDWTRIWVGDPRWRPCSVDCYDRGWASGVVCLSVGRWRTTSLSPFVIESSSDDLARPCACEGAGDMRIVSNVPLHCEPMYCSVSRLLVCVNFAIFIIYLFIYYKHRTQRTLRTSRKVIDIILKWRDHQKTKRVTSTSKSIQTLKNYIKYQIRKYRWNVDVNTKQKNTQIQLQTVNNECKERRQLI